MKDSPLVIRHLESLDVEILGSVHTLYSNVPRILEEIDRFSPGFVAIEQTDKERLTGSMDIDAINRKYHDRIVCVDRSPEITSSRYRCNTRPSTYLKECLHRYFWLPFNRASILTFNYLYKLYRTFAGDDFYTFGWSKEDTRRYIFERDEYMAARLIDHMRTRRDQGYRDRYAVAAGRRHVAGIAAILETFAVTGDIGSYYAGGRVIDVFSIAGLDRPYDVEKEEAASNLMWNRFAESLVRTVGLPVYMLILLLALAVAIALIALAATSVLHR